MRLHPLRRLLTVASLLLFAWSYARAGAAYLSTTEYSSFLWAILLGWLAQIEARDGIRVEQLTIDANDDASVGAELTLGRAR